MTTTAALTEAEMVRLWELHTHLEFVTKDAAATVATMTPDNYVNHIPVMTGGRGRDEMVEFYGKHFIPRMPSDTSLRLLARTVGNDRLVDEFVFSFTHDIEMDWMLPGILPTHRKVEVPMVVVVQFQGREDRLRSRIYWDQAFRFLSSIGLAFRAGFDYQSLVSIRLENFEDPQLPSNKLIRRLP